MLTYNCKIVVISTCIFENTPVIYEYVKNYSSIGTYIETANLELTHKKNNINVEIKQIATSLQMLQFIKINIENADLIVIFDAEMGNYIHTSIIDLTKTKPILKISNGSDYKNLINNKIFNLLELDILQQVQLHPQIQLQIDNRTTTIFGKTYNRRLISIDNWLDRWIFCCGYI